MREQSVPPPVRQQSIPANGRHDSILSTIGGTPVIRINRLGPQGVDLYVKSEAFNPMGSVKDRMALSVIEAAERSGDLQPGQTVIEATSGNTGIGLAMVCAAKGYPLVLTMAENFSIERRKVLRFLGAQVILTPAAYMGTGMVSKAEELAEAHGWFMVRQFENEANAEVHTRTTALEILEAFADRPLGYFVTGYGTGGTLKGTGQVLRQRSPSTRIVVCEPDNSPLLRSGIAQARHPDGRPDGSHPSFRPHLMQGWTPDFIPKLTSDAIDLHIVDEVIPIDGHEAMRCCRQLARREGIFVGTSGGGTFAGALAVAANAAPGSSILCMLPDTGERYLSTPLFEDIAVEMTEEEQQISRSTPGFRFDIPEVSTSNEDETTDDVALDAIAERFVNDTVRDAAQPVVVFALEWCEFCWSVRKLFSSIGVPYRSVDLDSVEYQQDDRGAKIRQVLTNRTGRSTIPQIYLAGQHLGGCTDIFEAFQNGELHKRLRSCGLEPKQSAGVDPNSFLPGWLHQR